MSNAAQDAFPPLWRVLGLSVAVGYASLGSFAALMPIQASTMYGLRSPHSTVQNDQYVSAACAWIGARDLSIAAALATFYHQSKPREMGVVILSGMILCATDTYFVFRHRKDAVAASVGLGAGIWMWIGYNLTQL